MSSRQRSVCWAQIPLTWLQTMFPEIYRLPRIIQTFWMAAFFIVVEHLGSGPRLQDRGLSF